MHGLLRERLLSRRDHRLERGKPPQPLLFDDTTEPSDEGARPASADRAPGGDPPGPQEGQAPIGAPLLELRNVDKNFGPVQALQGINLIIPEGQVTALAGDNGAGKSVLIKTVSGIWSPDGGAVFWQGQRVHIRTPKDAAA